MTLHSLALRTVLVFAFVYAQGLPTGVERVTSVEGITEYRLTSNGFLFKLCPRVTGDPLSTTPIAGMYIPFDYWKLLLASPQSRGPKGGPQITYDNVGRYLNNGLFVSLVEGGWLGTPIDDEEDLSGIIQAGLEGKRSVIYARASRD